MNSLVSIYRSSDRNGANGIAGIIPRFGVIDTTVRLF